MHVFKCKNCGKCCSIFGIKKNFLPIFDWELEIIKILPNKEKLIIKPTTIFHDSISEKYFAVIYGLFNIPCIYLENNECTNYENRFFVCRSFPILWTAKTTPDGIFADHCFGKCKNSKPEELIELLTKRQFTNKGISRNTKKAYPDCYDYCVNSNKINLYLTKLLIKLEEKKKIRIKRIELEEICEEKRKEITPFLKFLEERKLITKKKKELLEKKFEKRKRLS